VREILRQKINLHIVGADYQDVGGTDRSFCTIRIDRTLLKKAAIDLADPLRLLTIAEALRALGVISATLDGEGVVCDERGVSDFDRLRSALARRGGSRAAFPLTFDLLELDGIELRPQPWETLGALN
jgi:hypothetical protein